MVLVLLYWWMMSVKNGVLNSTRHHARVLSRFSHVQLFVTPWTVVGQAPLSMGFPRQEYWSRLSFPSPGNLLDPGIEPVPPAIGRQILLSLSHQGSPSFLKNLFIYSIVPCLRCGMWDLVPWQGIEPGPPALGASSFSHCITQKVPRFNNFKE